jgi:hypothetical protein
MWPELRVADWIATRDTLHLWTQVVGKIRMAFAPMINHWWQVTLYVSPRGLTTGSIPNGERSFDIEFDFSDHQLRIRTQDGDVRQFPLAGLSVADFHAATLSALGELGITVSIQSIPNEVDPAIPFAQDTEHASYDPDAVHLYWKQLVQADRVMNDFRARFGGKVSPVHFFWGAMDLACTRFSGRPAPAHPGGAPNCADWVMVEGYSHEVSSCGFWAGGGEEGAFYAYAYPEPEGFSQFAVSEPGIYDAEAGLFLLPYEAVRTADDPDAVVAQFLQSTYEAAAELADWDRSALEVDPDRWKSVARYARHG